jgi:predicted short-subunit dehydrogenase-like oxidoreductase (DUF2520 family)
VFERIRVIGRGRVGSSVAARLVERGHPVDADEPDLVLLCVPDAAIAGVAASIAPGPWIAHTSGATTLAALGPHERRFSVHPLMTFTRARGPEQMDGASAAITGTTPEALAAAAWLARELGLAPFELADAARPLYHAGASMASNFIVTLYRLGSRAFEIAGVPPEALIPLMRRTIDNGFELTGPISRGDWSTIEAHLAALERDMPDVVPLYRALTDATRR